MTHTDEQLNEAIAKAKGYTPKLCPCGCGITGWQTKYALIFRDWANEWGDAGELLEEMANAGVEPILRYDDSLAWMVDWQPQTITSFGERMFAPSPQRAICEAWLKWKGIEI